MVYIKSRIRQPTSSARRARSAEKFFLTEKNAIFEKKKDYEDKDVPLVPIEHDID
jgi:hypothetical protein